MQFAVPQFTDVEDKLVAGLTFKQFGIVFGAGILVFVVYTISQSLIATILSAILFGIPAIVAAFGRVNGRPIYTSFGPLVTHLGGGKVYVFQKQAQTARQHVPEVTVVAAAPKDAENPMVRLKRLNYTLQQQSSQKQELIDRIASQAADRRKQ